jgi:hypothetical protein
LSDANKRLAASEQSSVVFSVVVFKPADDWYSVLGAKFAY